MLGHLLELSSQISKFTSNVNVISIPTHSPRLSIDETASSITKRQFLAAILQNYDVYT